MFSRNFLQDYPNLFKRAKWPGPIQAKFSLCEKPPLHHLVSNVRVVPKVSDSWLIVQMRSGEWGVPGGTLEEGENILQTAKRELIEEAGASIETFHLFGAWHCFSKRQKPPRPHMPFPEFYVVAGIGIVDFIDAVENVSEDEQVIAAEVVSLKTAMDRFESCGRPDFSELYHLASVIYTEIDG